MSRVMAPRLKYFGKSLDCKVPNVFRGRFLYIVIPAMKVVHAEDPNQVAYDKRWMVAADWRGMDTRGDRAA